MRRLKRLAQRSRSDQLLLLRAWSLVAGVRIGLWIAPVDLVRRTSIQISRNSSSDADRVVWAVITAARYFPRATCLTQALAAHALLSGSRVEIGVAKEGKFEAHAWLVYENEIVLGGAESARYTPLLALEEAA